MGQHSPSTKNRTTIPTAIASMMHATPLDHHDDTTSEPDRRDQKGNAFDEGINEHTIANERPKSEDINDRNRYANIAHAQSRAAQANDTDK